MLKKKKIFWVIVILVVIWMIVGIIDFSRVHSFEKPIFSLGIKTVYDGGPEHYIGLGYSFDIEGNFMPEDELPGVTEYTFYLFGFKVVSGIRD